jgi:hypothetical protein
MSDGSCSPFHFRLLVVSPGNIADELSILYLKREKILDPDTGLVIQDTICRLSVLMDSILDRFNQEVNDTFWKLLEELSEVNRIQWDLEDRVRKESSWEAAQAARSNNSIRVEIKNKVNRLFGYPTEEKLYR